MEGGALESDLAADEGGVAEGGANVEVERAVLVQHKPTRPQ